jgi:WD40 repeat protein
MTTPVLVLLFSMRCFATQAADATSPAPTYTVEVGAKGADDITFVDGARLAWSTNEPMQLQLCEVRSGKVLWTHPKGGILGGFVSVVNAETGKEEASAVLNLGTSSLLGLDPKDRWLYSIAKDTQLTKSGLSERSTIASVAGKILDLEIGAITAMDVSKQGHIALGSKEGRLVIVSPDDRKVLGTMENGGAAIASLAWDERGSTFAVADGTTTVCIWDSSKRQRVVELKDHAAGVRMVAFVPKRTWLATADAGGRVTLWEVPAGSKTATLKRPDSRAITAMTVSPDGALVAAAGGDRICLWDLAGVSKRGK